MNYVGIDISKSYFDVALEIDGQYQHYRFSNDLTGFKELRKILKGQDYRFVMEASGPYYLKLACYLESTRMQVSVVNPLVIRRFCQMRMTRAKTDKKDAVMIAEYGKAEAPTAWQPEAAYMMEMRQLLAYAEQLDKSRTGYIRQLEAFRQNPCLSKTVKKGLEKMIKDTAAQIAAVEKQMESIIKLHHKDLFDRLKSIPGIGKKTGMTLVVISAGFTKFENAKQLSSYVGLSPRIFESGTSVKGKARICKMGMSRIRSMLYVCSWSAVKCNKACKDLYERLLAKGKPKMVALIAVANKLLKQCFAVATRGSYYSENYLQKACF